MDNTFNVPEFFNSGSFWDLLTRFGFNLLITTLIVRFIYYRKHRRKDYLFTYLVINTVIFLLAYLLSGVELKLGFAFGLFALFGILRYRTNPLNIKEMTYLFVIIGIAVVNSISDQFIPYTNIILANLLIVVILYMLEFAFRLSHESSKKVVYEKMDLIVPQRKQELLADLRLRTGINIHRVEIISVNFRRKTTQLLVYYYEKNRIFNAVERDFNLDDED